MTASDLSSSLNSAITAADFGARLVILGIAVEAIDLIVKCGENEGFCKWFGDPNRFEEMNLKRLKKFSKFFHPWTLAIEIASFALVVYGLSIEVSGSNEAYRISGLQNSKLNKEAGDARLIAGNAEREAGQANERAANTEFNNLVLRSKVAALESQMSPRTMEEYNPGIRLKIFSGTKVFIICALSDESQRFATQIGAILHFANWDLQKIVATPKPMPDGVVIGLCSTNESNLDIYRRWHNKESRTSLHIAAQSLVDEINNAGVDAKIDDKIKWRTSLRFDGVLIFVGSKPTILESKIFNLENEIWSLDVLSESDDFEQEREKLSLLSEKQDILDALLKKSGSEDSFEFKGLGTTNEQIKIYNSGTDQILP